MGSERKELKMEPERLRARLDDLYRWAGLTEGVDNVDNEEDVVDSLLNEFGIPRNLDGRTYIETAVNLRMSGIVKKEDGVLYLYQKTARKHETTRTRVERAIRYAVEHAFDCGNVEIIERYFGHALSAKTGKATNKQFIETVVAVIERRSK